VETQNITLSLPKDILHKVKIMAVQRHTSVSGFLTELLESIVAQEDEYRSAERRNLALLSRGKDMGTRGVVQWERDNLHER
jgi:hypothetical protein